MKKQYKLCGSVLLLIAVLLAMAPLCSAQLDTGSIAGVVSDPSGAVIPGVSIKITNVKTARTWKAKTGSIGEYSVPALPVGVYIVQASTEGFETGVVSGVVLHSADTARANFKLTVGSSSIEVVVNAEQVAINTATSDTGETITSKFVENIPLNGRDLYTLTALTPGADVAGGYSNGNETIRQGMNILLDGTDATRVDVNSSVDNTGRSVSRITRASVDSVQEVQIMSSNYSAAYGRAEGAIVNVITKSGGNDLHGGVFEFIRNDAFDAKNYFSTPTLPTPLRMNQFGGNVTGPIKRNKVFFFFNYEGIRQLITQDQKPVPVFNDAMRALAVPAVKGLVDAIPEGGEGPVPDATSVTTVEDPVTGLSKTVTTTTPYSNWFNYLKYQNWTRDNEDTGSLKLDWTVGPSDSIALRYNLNNGLTDQKYGPVAGQTDEAPNRVHLAKLTWNHTFSPTFLNEAGLTVNRPRTNSYNYGGGYPAISCFFCNIGFGEIPGPGFLQFTIHQPQQSVQAIDTATKIVDRNQIKFGFDIRNRRLRNDLTPWDSMSFSQSSSQNTMGTSCDASGTTCTITGLPDGFLSNTGLTWGRQGYPMMALYSADLSFFINDDIQVTRRFTLNLGLRYDYSTIQHDPHQTMENFDLASLSLLNPHQPLYIAPKSDFGPRVGFNLDVFGNGKTVVRGGAGLFYLPGPVGVPGLAGNTNQNFSINIFQTSGFGTTQINCNPAVVFAYPEPATLPTCTPSAPQGITFWDRNDHDTHTAQWNLTAERQLRKNLLWNVAYVGNRGMDVYSLGETNPQIDANSNRLLSNSFTSVQRNGNFAQSWYHSFQSSVRGSIGSLLLNGNYTWSHETDDSSGFWGEYQNIYDLKHEWASGDGDVRHLYSAGFIYGVPSVRRIAQFVPRKLAENWQVSGIVLGNTGHPVNITNGGASMSNSRPNLVPGVKIQTGTYPNNQFNPAAFEWLPWGSFGNSPRNIARGPSFFEPDVSLNKITKLTEKVTWEFKADVFNFVNHPNFQAPGAQISGDFGFLFGTSSQTVGQYVGLGTSRQIQFSSRFNF